MKKILNLLTILLLLFSPLTAEAVADRPISQYCLQVQEQLKKSSRLQGFSKIATIDFEVYSTGEIGSISEKQSDSGQVAAKAILKSVKMVAAPPAFMSKPVWLTVEFGKQLKDLEVNWRDVDFTGYMRALQIKIK